MGGGGGGGGGGVEDDDGEGIDAEGEMEVAPPMDGGPPQGEECSMILRIAFLLQEYA